MMLNHIDSPSIICLLMVEARAYKFGIKTHWKNVSIVHCERESIDQWNIYLILNCLAFNYFRCDSEGTLVK